MLARELNQYTPKEALDSLQRKRERLDRIDVIMAAFTPKTIDEAALKESLAADIRDLRLVISTSALDLYRSLNKAGKADPTIKDAVEKTMSVRSLTQELKGGRFEHFRLGPLLDAFLLPSNYMNANSKIGGQLAFSDEATTSFYANREKFLKDLKDRIPKNRALKREELREILNPASPARVEAQNLVAKVPLDPTMPRDYGKAPFERFKSELEAERAAREFDIKPFDFKPVEFVRPKGLKGLSDIPQIEQDIYDAYVDKLDEILANTSDFDTKTRIHDLFTDLTIAYDERQSGQITPEDFIAKLANLIKSREIESNVLPIILGLAGVGAILYLILRKK